MEGPRKRQCLGSIGSTSDIPLYESSCATEPQIDSFDFDDVDEGQVCLGMITTALQVSRSQVSSLSRSRHIVALNIQSSLVTVHDYPNFQYLGLLDSQIGTVLAELAKHYLFGHIAYLAEQQEAADRDVAESMNRRSLHIVMSCNEECGDQIGKFLAENDAFLQHPYKQDILWPYKNPQYLLRPGESYTPLPEEYTKPSDLPVDSGTELDTSILDDIYASASGPDDYTSVQPSSRLTTPLKSHQEKGLAMMLEKERGNLVGTEFGTMWTPSMLLNGNISYTNIVNGVMKENPEPYYGGILADEMGLGKSLTIIALIATSLDYMEKDNPHSPHPKRILEFQVQPQSKSTLIVTPKATLQSWEEQFERHVKRSELKVCYYVGPKRHLQELSTYDVVVTTYATLLRERTQGFKQEDKLLRHDWLRVVLDEAHTIRNTSAKQSLVVGLLRATYRWCVTGTPIQNRVEDFGSLLKFLRASPFDSSFAFKSDIADLIDCGNERGIVSLRAVIRATCLRRTKAILDLPFKTSKTQEVNLDVEEKRLYDSYATGAISVIETALTTNAKINSFATMLQLVLRLRQICNHGTLLLPSEKYAQHSPNDHSHAWHTSSPSSIGVARCEVCGRTIGPGNPVLLCWHLVCQSCLTQQQPLNDGEQAICPVCEGTPVERTESDNELNFGDGNYQPSSKVSALVRNLIKDRQDSKLLLRPLKSVVFSCWTKMLGLIEIALNMNGIKFARLDGKMTNSRRKAEINTFRNSRDCMVLLASIGSAGVGIDLTIASRVHLMEPQWNPMVEEQAIDRVHRLGQTMPVTAFRYIVKDSIDEYVLGVNKRKLEVIQRSLGSACSDLHSNPLKRLEHLREFLMSRNQETLGQNGVTLICGNEMERASRSRLLRDEPHQK